MTSKANKLALGAAQFGLAYGVNNQCGQVTRAAAKDMLKLATACGVNILDTAIAYGESEASLGEIGVNGFQLVTKLPAFPESCVDVSNWVNEQVAASLSRLNVQSLYGLLLHRPDQLLSPRGKMLYQALDNLKDCGLVKKIGVSIYAPTELDALSPRFQFDLVQAPYNILDQRLRISGWLSRLKDYGVEVHTRSAFLQGLLLMHNAEIPDKFKRWCDLWSKWHIWLNNNNITALVACLSAPLSLPEIDRVVVGADSCDQLYQIICAANCDASLDLPDLACDDDDLINPSRWNSL